MKKSYAIEKSLIIFSLLFGFSLLAQAQTDLNSDSSIEEAVAEVRAMRELRLQDNLWFSPARPRGASGEVMAARTQGLTSIWVVPTSLGTQGDRLMQNRDAIEARLEQGK